MSLKVHHLILFSGNIRNVKLDFHISIKKLLVLLRNED